MIRKLLLLSTALSSMAFANEDAKTYQSFDSDYSATLTVVPTAKSDRQVAARKERRHRRQDRARLARTGTRHCDLRP